MKNKKDIIRFNIDDKQYIEAIIPCKLKNIYRFEEVEIFLHSEDKKYILFEMDFIVIAISDLYDLLIKVLNYDSYLDKSISYDIGFLWNEYLQDKKDHNFVERKRPDSDSDYEFWVGQDYLLWSSLHDTETWLYNKDNSIYLEVSPNYKWHSSEPKKNEKFISYDEWIKSYKPIAIIEIRKEVAKQWLEKSIEIMNIIEEYDRKYLKKDNSEI